jgi:hypothetical protein
MKLTRDNYEIWFLDYLEGSLEQGQMDEVRLFLSLNPDLAEELESFAPALSANKGVIFPNKNKLKKDSYEDPLFFETAAIAAMEGDLDQEELNSFEKWLAKNPDKQELIHQFERTRLKPDPSITYPVKAVLKKKTTVIAFWFRVVSVAAILLLAVFLFYPTTRKQDSPARITAGTSMPEQSNPVKKDVADAGKVIPVTVKADNRQKQNALHMNRKVKKIAAPDTPLVEVRQTVSIAMLEARSIPVHTFVPVFTDLVPLKTPENVFFANNEISLSDFLENKLQTMKANGPKRFFSREEFTIAGLHLFSRLPGNHLTGKKGSDGRLKTISFNTPLLAFSIPVNREL